MKPVKLGTAILNSAKKDSRVGRDERGQSLVELALSLVVILMLLTGAVEFGLAYFQFVTMRDAAQEGALYGSINPVDAKDVLSDNGKELRDRVIAAAGDVLQLSAGDIEVEINDVGTSDDFECEGLNGGVPNSITVTVTFAHPITMPLVTPFIGTETINLTARVTDTILQPACD